MSTIWDIRFAKNEWPRFGTLRFWMRAPAGGAVRGRSGKGKFGSEMRNSLQKRLVWRDRGLIIPYLAAMSHGGRPGPELAGPGFSRRHFGKVAAGSGRILHSNIFFAASKSPPHKMKYGID